MPNRSFYGTACKAFSPGCRASSSQIARKHPLMELPRRFEKGGVFRKVRQKVELSSCQFDMVYLAAIIQCRSAESSGRAIVTKPSARTTAKKYKRIYGNRNRSSDHESRPGIRGGAGLEIVELKFPSRAQDRSASRYRRVVCATATR